MLQWLADNHGRASVNKNDRIKLNNLREEVEQLRSEKNSLVQNLGLDEEQVAVSEHDSEGPGSELQSDEDEDDDEVDDLPLNVIQAKK